MPHPWLLRAQPEQSNHSSQNGTCMSDRVMTPSLGSSPYAVPRELRHEAPLPLPGSTHRLRSSLPLLALLLTIPVSQVQAAPPTSAPAAAPAPNKASTTSPATSSAGRPLVLDLTTFSANPRLESLTPFIAQETGLPSGSYPIMTSANPTFGELYHWLFPSDESTCQVPLQPLEDRLKAVDALLVELELDKAIALLQLTWDEISCSVTPIPRESLRRLFYLEGIAHLYNSDASQSQRAFLEAIAIEPSLMPISGYAPEVNDAYLQAARGLPDLEPQKIAVESSLSASNLFIDGEPLTGTELSLRPGRHTAQRFNDAGVARTAGFEIQKGETRSLATIVNLTPPDTANYHREMLRTSMLSGRLSVQEIRVMASYAQLQGHAYLLFVLADSATPGGLKLRIFVPGKGLVDKIPPGIAPLPALDLSKKLGTQPKPGNVSQPSTENKAKKGRVARPKLPGEEEQLEARFSLGPRAYGARPFLTLQPAIGYHISKLLSAEFSLYYGLGSGEGAGPQSIVGLRPAVSVRGMMGTLALRGALGLNLTAMDVVVVDSAPVLQLQLMPELEGSALYAIQSGLSAGIQAGLGLSPGLLGTVGTTSLWQMGLLVQTTF